MARTLPWKKNGASTGAKPNKPTLARSNIPARAPETLAPTSPPRVTQRKTLRPLPRSITPEQKRPAGVLDDGRDEPDPKVNTPKPLSERFMIPGLEHDDRWRMVEDEFVAVAHKFTAHLHAAEYQRLMEQAKDHNADAIRSLSRPVSGPMADRVQRRQRSPSWSTKRAPAQTQDADQEDDGELPWAGTNLEGLMDSPRKKRVSLATIVSTTSNTRAAALRRQDSMPGRRGGSTAAAEVHAPGGISQQPGLPAWNRQRHARCTDAESDEEIPRRDAAATRPTKTSVLDTPRSSAQAWQRLSSAAPGGAVKAPVPVSQPLSFTSSNLVDDDSDSSVDLLFDMGKHSKRGTTRRTRS